MSPTQRERREATITRLVDAAIATIDEVGYARTSAQLIATRAGLSYGALFRHFATMSDFMAATARETVRRHTTAVANRFREAARESGRTDLESLLRVLHDLSGVPTHTAILELTMAARTDPSLQTSLQQAIADGGTEIIQAAREMLGYRSSLSDEDFTNLVFMITDLHDAEALQHPFRAPYPQISNRRIPLLLQMLECFGLDSAIEAALPEQINHAGSNLDAPR
ncbi:TetR/AcrR family transcriptional regulator [Gordonia polyisoprenivorans]|uniref:TetR/AcrR family transcriptional regulator n=1 Tax=Gordonia polyisoprenivorans TaxID=84595 RepID=UPI0018CAB39A|nr:TetR/AcrR family transcriptional regulator [Gordonia polyisoprenivorans]QUD82955.1 TetR/AcrR family transcriptional regulator [Gordonia polyisoprenivorans]